LRVTSHRDCGGHWIEAVDWWTFMTLQKLAGVWAEALDEPSLALGVERVQAERGFSRARHSGYGDELAWVDFETDTLEIVGSCVSEDGAVHEIGAEGLFAWVFVWLAGWCGEIKIAYSGLVLFWGCAISAGRLILAVSN